MMKNIQTRILGRLQTNMDLGKIVDMVMVSSSGLTEVGWESLTRA